MGASVAAIAACYPDQINSVEDLSSVTTVVDSQAPLESARTFALPDTVIHAMRGSSTGTTLVGHEADAQLLARIRARFVERRWREIASFGGERPDVVVLTAVLEQTNTGVAYGGWWSDWGYWPGWSADYSAWGWGYPSAVTFTYQSGTLLIVMLDLRNGDTQRKRLPILWAAGIEGVLTLSSLDGALAGIDQAFAQSPYLERP